MDRKIHMTVGIICTIACIVSALCVFFGELQSVSAFVCGLDASAAVIAFKNAKKK